MNSYEICAINEDNWDYYFNLNLKELEDIYKKYKTRSKKYSYNMPKYIKLRQGVGEIMYLKLKNFKTNRVI